MGRGVPQLRHGVTRTMLNIKELTKTYSSGIQALKGVSLDVPSGMFGLPKLCPVSCQSFWRR